MGAHSTIGKSDDARCCGRLELLVFSSFNYDMQTYYVQKENDERVYKEREVVCLSGLMLK